MKEEEAGKPGNLDSNHNQEQEHNEGQQEQVADTAAQGTSTILTAEKRNITYPKMSTTFGHTASPSAVDTIEPQQHHQEQRIVSHMLGTDESNRIGPIDTNVAWVDTIQNYDNHGIMPLPRLGRSTANSRAQVQPGAYPGGGDFQGIEENLETAETHIEPATEALDLLGFRPPTIEPENDNSGLVVANLVEDETAPQDLPQAQDYTWK
ncbi:expressed unknown protein [Seminavis robusta]|uniref:Uncharacterized protein n=1 Tax=Seminavis robusta TaxID=568900 RepID=A0A9N8HL72_9STRA|nr:expressed unknown protein [Seminavis robusta]|eukprot:Sro892_g216980.1 n/a (208) ;mRNA; f:30535-31158